MSAAGVTKLNRDEAPAAFRAWSLRHGDGIDGLVMRAIPRRTLHRDEVRVRVDAVALNHRDLMIAAGTSGAAERAIVPASDAAGEVLEVGSDVTTLAVGDRVVSAFFPDWQAGTLTAAATARVLGGTLDGVLAEQVIASERTWLRLPGTIDAMTAATLPCAGLTAWHALFGLDPLPPGSTIAVLGTGGVSIWALQLAKAAGLRVIVTSSDDAKLARVRALGADATVNYRTTPNWGSALRALTSGRGVDRVLDIGGPDTIAQSITAIRHGGTVAVIGRLTGLVPASFDPAALFAGGKRLAGLMVGHHAMAGELARFVANCGLEAIVDRVFAFDHAPDAYRHLASGGHLGKVIIEVRGALS